MTAQEVDRIKVKSATVTAKLRADSGYKSDESHRISPDQWRRIVEIMLEETK